MLFVLPFYSQCSKHERVKAVRDDMNRKTYLQSLENYSFIVVYFHLNFIFYFKKNMLPLSFHFSFLWYQLTLPYVVKRRWKQTPRAICCTYDSQYVWRSMREDRTNTYKVLSVYARLSIQRVFVLTPYLSLRTDLLQALVRSLNSLRFVIFTAIDF